MIDPSLRLRRAVHANDTLLVKRILKSHPGLLHNPDASEAGLSNSSLHLAASIGHAETCELLLALGHEDDAPALNEHHQTALHLAAFHGYTEVVLLLSRARPASIPLRDLHGRDAIMEASRGGHDTTLQILLTYDPVGPEDAVRRADLDGNTALHFASMHGHLPVLRTLLAAGADPDHKNVWSWTALAYSATVAAEVYLRNLIADMDKQRKAGQRMQQYIPPPLPLSLPLSPKQKPQQPQQQQQLQEQHPPLLPLPSNLPPASLKPGIRLVDQGSSGTEWGGSVPI